MEQRYGTTSILSIPLEILEFILSMLPFHRDLPNACLVCRNWYDVGITLIKRSRMKFLNILESGPLIWSHMSPRLITPPSEIISPRYSHAACFHDGAMYIFGGTTSDTTYFNDVLKYNLAENRWSRITSKNARGPLPKSGATLVVHNGQLVIYGGQSRDIQGIHQEGLRFHRELHLFDLRNEVWDIKMGTATPPRAAHQAGIIGDYMLVTCGSNSLHRFCNDVWLLDMVNYSWVQVNIREPLPSRRAYHSQAVLNNENIVIMGGINERNEPLGDVWLLTLCENKCGFWTSLAVNKNEIIFRYSGQVACQVEKKMVMLGKVTRTQKYQKSKQKCAYCLRQLIQPRNVRPVSYNPLTMESPQMNVPLRFRPSSRNNRDRLRNEVLDFHSERFRMPSNELPSLRGVRPLYNRQDENASEKCTCPDKKDADEKFQKVHVLDLSSALVDRTVVWQVPIQTRQLRSDAGNTSFYSLVSCIDRIAMFGGVNTLGRDETMGSSIPTTNQLSFLSFKELSLRDNN